LEEQVVDISHNMSHMATLARNLRPFKEAIGSNSYIKSKGKMGDNEDLEKDSRK
jgi:hypothetical protein